MESLEATRLSLELKQRGLEQGIEAVRRKRPNAGRICQEWLRFTTLWEAATEEEWEELMQAMVVRVEMNEKEEGTCEVALLPQAPSWLELTPKMGADGDFSAINPPISNARVARIRTDQPIIRPKRKMRRRDFTVRGSVG